MLKRTNYNTYRRFPPDGPHENALPTRTLPVSGPRDLLLPRHLHETKVENAISSRSFIS
jgi:hypothetical protein